LENIVCNLTFFLTPMQEQGTVLNFY